MHFHKNTSQDSGYTNELSRIFRFVAFRKRHIQSQRDWITTVAGSAQNNLNLPSRQEEEGKNKNVPSRCSYNKLLISNNSEKSTGTQIDVCQSKIERQESATSFRYVAITSNEASSKLPPAEHWFNKHLSIRIDFCFLVYYYDDDCWCSSNDCERDRRVQQRSARIWPGRTSCNIILYVGVLNSSQFFFLILLLHRLQCVYISWVCARMTTRHIRDKSDDDDAPVTK